MTKIAKPFTKIDIDDIIAWCTENDKMDWLIEESAKTVTVERHIGRVKKLEADGSPALNKAGNPIWIADKASPKKQFKQPITFVELKYNFCEKFMPDKLPKATKEKAPTMLDKIKAAAEAAKN